MSFTEIERVWQLRGLGHQKKLDTSPLTIEELDALCKQLIDEIQADILAFEERSAIQAEVCADGKMTTQRALESLQQPERFFGEHQVARIWLREYAPHAAIFKKENR
jgi:hypothetical protein